MSLKQRKIKLKPRIKLNHNIMDGGELCLMNGDTNLGGNNLPPLWLLFFCNILIMSCHELMTTITSIHQRWGQLQRHKVKACDSPTRRHRRTRRRKKTEKRKCASYQKKKDTKAKAKSKQPLTGLAPEMITENTMGQN